MDAYIHTRTHVGMGAHSFGSCHHKGGGGEEGGGGEADAIKAIG